MVLVARLIIIQAVNVFPDLMKPDTLSLHSENPVV
jgi:hypothetical protein